MIPQVEDTLSKLASANVSCSASPTTYSISSPSSAARSLHLDQDGRNIETGHARAGRSSALGDRARAASKVEPAVARLRRQPLDDVVVDVGERLGDPLVGPVAPHHALPLLQLLVRHRLLSLGVRLTGRTGVELPPSLLATTTVSRSCRATADSSWPSHSQEGPNLCPTITGRTYSADAARLPAQSRNVVYLCSGLQGQGEPVGVPPQAEQRGRGLVLIGIIAVALATGLTAPSFVPSRERADPAPEPPLQPRSCPDPAPEPTPTQSLPPPSTSNPPAVESTPTPAPVVQSTAPAPPKPKPKPKTRAHPGRQMAELRQGAFVPKWRRSRDAVNARSPAPATAEPQLASIRATSTGGSAAMILLAAFAAGLAAMLLAAVPAYALWRTWVFRPLVNRRFELGVTGVSILVGIVFAKGLIGP